jgi:hypothetical protein|tara:strand:+ start:1911 stop:4424 length:2514 start_codon:yes stop_codon:yes gene_type:complete
MGWFSDDSESSVEESAESFQKFLLDNVEPAITNFTSDIRAINPTRTKFSIVKGVDSENLLNNSTSPKVRQFIDLPDALRRSLVPIVKIYKTYANKDGERVDLRIRTDPYGNGVSRVDLERVDFTRLGGNPAEVDTNIKFNIKLSARELGFYFQKQYPISEGATGTTFAIEREVQGVAWIDLIKIDPGRELQLGELGNSELVINELDARMKVVLGYASPTTQPSGVTAADWNEWKEIITSQREVFSLNLFKHEFDFKASGEVALSVNFIASGNAKMLVPEADILLGTQDKERLEEINEELRQIRRRERELPDASEIDAEEQSYLESCVEEESESIAAEREEFEQERENILSRSKRRLINQLELHTPMSSNSRIMFYNSREDDNGRTRTSWSPSRAVATESLEFDKPYVLLGDIIEGALEILAENGLLGEEARIRTRSIQSTYRHYQTGNELEIHLKPFGMLPVADLRRIRTIQEYGGIFLTKLKYEKISRTGNQEIPLLHLPISLDFFKQWWTTTVDSKSSFHFKDFINSLLNTFVANKVFSDDMYEEGDREDLEHPQFSISTTPAFIDKIDDVTRSPNALTTGIITTEDYELLVPKLEIESDNVTNIGSVMVIQQVKVESSIVSRNDVPNLLWGQSTRGILESVQFQREDIPGLSEARLFADRSSTANNLMLREKYNTTLQMLGNVAFLPGSQLYLDPRPLDLGFSEDDGSLARSLGLGGLYVVNYVDHEIDLIKKSWTTKLDTKWESYGDGTGGDDTTNPLAEVCSEDTLRLREIDELRRYRVQLRLNRQIFEETYTEERLATVFTYRANESELLRTAAEIEVLQEQLTPEESEES